MHLKLGQGTQFKWEVVVVCDPAVNAFSLPGGKIVVFTGLLKHFALDAEIATIIGHEVCVLSWSSCWLINYFSNLLMKKFLPAFLIC